MKVLDLFSGIGGFSLGLERAGMETVAFCEFEPHARAILKKHWPDVPIHEDVRTLNAKQYRGSIDVVCGGFPCQDLSMCGKTAGFEGERSSLYREMLRIISDCRPGYAIFENVTGLLTGESGQWFARFLYDLAEVGYDAEWQCIRGDNVGMPTYRDRIWILACPKEKHVAQILEPGRLSRELRRMGADHISRTRWAVDRDRMGRGVNGLPSRVDRFERLGNTVYPQIPEAIGKAIINFEKQKDIPTMKYLIFSRSTHCAACDSVKGFMKAHDIEYTELKADIDQLEAMKHRVLSVPTTIRFDSDGLEVNRIAGFQIDEARKFFK